MTVANMAKWAQTDRRILPDARKWGRGYGGKGFDKVAIQETRGYVLDMMKLGGLPGYEKRGLIDEHPAFSTPRKADGNFILPPGFDADGPGRRKAHDPQLIEPNFPTTTEGRPWQVRRSLKEYYKSCGYPLDQHGRAVHPLLVDIVNADIPICTGYGAGWEGGQTVVVDTVVTDGESVLFTTLQDHGKTLPSLVGGYTRAQDFSIPLPKWRAGQRQITEEGIFRAVRRIVAEKTGIVLPDDARFEIMWGIRPWSSYHTANFWTVTYTVKIVLRHGALRNARLKGNAFLQSVSRTGPIVDNLWPDHRRGYLATTRH
jgi:hypothetical protein